MRQKCRTVLFVFVILFLFFSIVFAGGGVMWQEGGVPVGSSISYTFGRHVIVSDMKGGAIVGWSEGRDPHNGVYAQRVDSSGNVLWQDNGTPVCTTGFFFDPYNLCAVSDGYGGAIFVWEDMRYEYDLYAQRIDSSGNVLWNPAGVPVCDYDSVQAYPSIVSDGVGGCIVAWADCRHGGFTNRDIYTQRLSSSGNRLWLIDGVAVCTAINHQYYPEIKCDGKKGELIVWDDFRSGDGDIYLQGIDSVGQIQWANNGIPVCTTSNNQVGSNIIYDGSNGIIVWNDKRTGERDIYSQRFDISGVMLWQINGIPVCNYDSSQSGGQIVSDLNKGGVIVWIDERYSSYFVGGCDLFSQRIDSMGVLQWLMTGVPVCLADSNQLNPKIIADEQSGAIIAWKDERGFYDGIYVQHIDSSGICLWDSNGMFISSNTADAGLPVIVEDGVGGAIIAWSDGRPKGIYAQRVGDVAGIQEKRDHRQKNEEQRLLLCHPNPFTTAFSVKCSGFSEKQKVTLEIYDISGRLVKRLVRGEVPNSQFSILIYTWDGRDDRGRKVRSGIYFLKLKVKSEKLNVEDVRKVIKIK